MGAILYFSLIMCATTWSLASALTLKQPTTKPRHTKFSASTTEETSPLATPASSSASKDDSGVAYYRMFNIKSGATCILLKTDAVVEVVKRKTNTPCHSLVKTVLKKTYCITEVMEYGTLKEKVAKSIFEQVQNVVVVDSGLWVDVQHGFLGASPDGLVDDDALLEIKCLHSASKLNLQTNTISEIIDLMKNKICLEKHNNKIQLKRNDNCYYQVRFKLHELDEQADSFIPEKALIEGDCKDEDVALMRISWTGYSMIINFAKTPGGERWYISSIELSVSPDLPQFHGIPIQRKSSIKLYHRKMLIPTPVGKSYSCSEVEVPLETDEEDNPPPGIHGTLFLRLLQVQAFMYRSESFDTSFECKPQMLYRDETAPIAVGSTLAVAVLLTIIGYAAYRYFKVKNVQYNTME